MLTVDTHGTVSYHPRSRTPISGLVEMQDMTSLRKERSSHSLLQLAFSRQSALHAEAGGHLLRTFLSLTRLILTITLEGAIFSCVLWPERLTTPRINEVT